MRTTTFPAILICVLASMAAAPAAHWGHYRHDGSRGYLDITNSDRDTYSLSIDYDNWALYVRQGGSGGDVRLPPGRTTRVELRSAGWTMLGDGAGRLQVAVPDGRTVQVTLSPFGPGRGQGLIGTVADGRYHQSETLFRGAYPPGGHGRPMPGPGPGHGSSDRNVGQAIVQGLVQGLVEGLFNSNDHRDRDRDRDRPKPPPAPAPKPPQGGHNRPPQGGGQKPPPPQGGGQRPPQGGGQRPPQGGGQRPSSPGHNAPPRR